MEDGIKLVIDRLEQQKSAIERALAALNGIEVTIEAKASSPATRKRHGITPAGRRRLSLALKQRWAAKRASTAVPAKAASRKGGMTPEGRRKLAAAMRQRWALAKAAGTTPIAMAQRKRAKKAA